MKLTIKLCIVLIVSISLLSWQSQNLTEFSNHQILERCGIFLNKKQLLKSPPKENLENDHTCSWAFSLWCRRHGLCSPVQPCQSQKPCQQCCHCRSTPGTPYHLPASKKITIFSLEAPHSPIYEECQSQ